jgi:hypothetical protein
LAKLHFPVNTGLVTVTTPKSMTTAHSPFIRAKSETSRAKPCRLALTDTTFTCFNCDKLGYIAKECLESRRGDFKEIEKELKESYNDQDEDLRKEEL